MKNPLIFVLLLSAPLLAQVAHAANPLVGEWKNIKSGSVIKITPKGLPDVTASNCGSEAFSSRFTQTNKSSIKQSLANSLNKAQMQDILKQLPSGLVQGYDGVCNESYSSFYLAKPSTVIGVFCEVEDCSVATFRKIDR